MREKTVVLCTMLVASSWYACIYAYQLLFREMYVHFTHQLLALTTNVSPVPHELSEELLGYLISDATRVYWIFLPGVIENPSRTFV